MCSLPVYNISTKLILNDQVRRKLSDKGQNIRRPWLGNSLTFESEAHSFILLVLPPSTSFSPSSLPIPPSPTRTTSYLYFSQPLNNNRCPIKKKHTLATPPHSPSLEEVHIFSVHLITQQLHSLPLPPPPLILSIFITQFLSSSLLKHTLVHLSTAG